MGLSLGHNWDPSTGTQLFVEAQRSHLGSVSFQQSNRTRLLLVEALEGSNTPDDCSLALLCHAATQRSQRDLKVSLHLLAQPPT